MEVIAEERLPSLIGIRRASGQAPGDRDLVDVEAEFQMLAVYPGGGIAAGYR